VEGRDLASRTTKLILRRAMGAETASKVSAFRVFRAVVASVFKEYRSLQVRPVRNDARTIASATIRLENSSAMR
jgi:hypothetical protein